MYKKAIENLTSKEINFEAICIEIAKSNPSIFNKAFVGVRHSGHDNNYSHRALAPYEYIPNDSDRINFMAKGLTINEHSLAPVFEKWGNELWFYDVMQFLCSVRQNGPEKIKAIKAYRAVTKDGLRNCKHFIEDLMDSVGVSSGN